MLFPAINDTIIAVSSGWQASPLGIVRLSGPGAWECAASVGLRPPVAGDNGGRGPFLNENGLITAGQLEFPGTACWFKAPRSYTGQDIVELHVPGCLPLLRELCARLIERGARRALPGEFTARAYLAGKLSVEQVEDVLATISADRDSEHRQQRRAARAALERHRAALREKLADLLARVEAGIDFVEEEGVDFLSAAALRSTLDELVQELADCCRVAAAPTRLARPHVALVGLPNAGKSTLFNALLGYERAIVSPVLGTTRDVLSAEICLDGVQLVLQDCAGLGRTADDLTAAAHLAAERNAAQADVLVWVQAWDVPWDAGMAAVLDVVPPDRRLVVLSKSDLAGGDRPAPVPASVLGRHVAVSAARGEGMAELRRQIAECVCRVAMPPAVCDGTLAAATAALERARGLCEGAGVPEQLELISLEVRSAYEGLEGRPHAELVDNLLGRLFSEFCIGK
jgi:tRNA modification GTPase